MTAPLQVGGSIVLLRRLSRQLVAYLGDQVYIDRRRKIRIQSHWSRLHDPAATDHSNVYYHPDPERFRGWSPAEQVLGYFALSDHETAHLRYTDRNAWLRFTARYSGSSMLQLLAHHLLNILEDARIERAHLEEWPATTHRLAWLNEQYYEAADPIRPDMDPATALVMALNQAKFGFYFHAGAFKGTLPPEVDAYWPEAKAHLDASRMAATTHEVVAHHAEAILQKILDSRWLRDSSRLLRPQIGIGVSRPNRVPGTSRPRPAPPRRRDRHGGSGGQGRTDADRERRSESPPGQSPLPHSSTGSRQEHDADSAPETQAGLGLGAEDADQSASGNGVPGNSNGGEQDPSETGEDGQSDASGAPDGAAGAEQEARARSGSRRENGDPDTESAADDTDNDGGGEGSGDPNGLRSDGNRADSDEPARGMSQADPKSDGGSADGSGSSEDDTNAPAGREGQGSFGEDHREDGGSAGQASRPGETGDRRPEASSGSGRSGASTEASGEERGADPGAEAVLDGSCAGDGSGDDAPEVPPSVEEAAREANALLRQIQREEHEVIDGAVASAQELLEAARTSLPPIRMDDVPPDLHAEIVPVVRHAGLHPEALEPYYLESEPVAGRLARQMQALLERRRQSLRGLRKGRPDPRRVRLEEVSDRIMMRRTQEGQLDVAVLISVDESGSMFAANRVVPARRALCLLHGALRRLRIPHAIVGHSAARQHVFARVLVGFRESLRPTAWWSLANGPDPDLNEKGGGEARDGYSLRLGAKWLVRQPQRQKLLLFISDGRVNHTFRPVAAPGDPRYDYSLSGGVGVLDTRLAVREAEKSGIQVVGISIGEEHAYMESIYPRRICCRTVEELPAAFVKILSSLILTA